MYALVVIRISMFISLNQKGKLKVCFINGA